MSDITYEQFMEMKKKFDEAENDDTPYIAVVDDEVSIVGDAEKTERKKGNYKMQFWCPNNDMWKARIEGEKIVNETENYIAYEREYENVWVSPRVQTAVMTSFVELYKFFYMVSEDGQIRDLTADEVIMALRSLSQEMTDAMCHAVATVLRIDPMEEQFMFVTQTARTIIQMIDDFPEIINGMDFFTDKSSVIA